MSLFSTLVHEGTVPAKVFSPRRLVPIIGAALLAAFGFFVFNISTDESPEAVHAATASLTQAEFIRLNTTALDALAPAAAIESQMDVNPFLYWNTTALDAFAPAAAIKSQMDVDPFLYWNSTALDALTPAAAIQPQRDVDPFLYWNTTVLEYPQAPYSEPKTGPR